MSWLKTLLLFFDKIAILVPEYMQDRPRAADPVLAGPMEDMGLLVLLRPERFVDAEMTNALALSIRSLLEEGAFDDLPQAPHFAELSRSRMGWNADIELSKELIEALQERGLARDTEDGVSVPLHPTVRTAILVLLSQLARSAGQRQGLDLHPITASRERVVDLMQTLNLSDMPTAGRVIMLDLETVTLNLETVALEDVLEFREEHRDEHRSYARSVRQAVHQLSAMPESDRERALADRREELADHADELRRLARKRWRLPLARFGLGAAGATVNIATGNVPAAIVSALGGLIGVKPEAPTASAYSYLFSVEKSLSRE